MPEKKKRITESDIFKLLQVKFPAPAYALMPHVRNSTGISYSKVRTADAVSMSLWPSRGLILSGFEIKVSRADWLIELKKPEKADEIASYCDEWWLVVSDKNIVGEGELPHTWGLLTKYGRGLRCIKQPKELKAKRIDRTFLAALLRRAFEYMPSTQEAQAVRKEGYDEGYQSHKTENSYEIKRHETLKKCVRKYKEASGIDVQKEYEWGEGIEMGKCLAMFKSGIKAKERLLRLRGELKMIEEKIDEALQEEQKK